MKHPNQGTLALHAGGDLGAFARWRVERHLAQCDACREEVAAYQAMREILPDLAEIPEVPWNRLAAEMKANIRLGLAAGECVREGRPLLIQTAFFTRARAAVAMASAAVLVVTGFVLERPAPRVTVDEGTVVQATANGIQVRKWGQTLRLMNVGADNATYSPDAEGSMRALFVDHDTGQMTINRVYAE